MGLFDFFIASTVINGVKKAKRNDSHSTYDRSSDHSDYRYGEDHNDSPYDSGYGDDGCDNDSDR